MTTNRHNILHKRQQYSINQLKKIRKDNNLTIVKADKTKTILIINKEKLKVEVNNFIIENHMEQLDKDPTEAYQKQIHQTIQKCSRLIDKHVHKYLLNIKPMAPQLNVYIKTHKENQPIRPVINNVQAPSYKVTQYINKRLQDLICLPYTYNTKNSQEVAEELIKLQVNEHMRIITLDIKDMDEFFDQLSQECEKARKYDILILLRDFNAKIGRENFIATVAGKYTLHEVTSENRKWLGQLAVRNNIIIKSTCFEHKAIHKGTWMCPGTDVVNQTDHVIINKRHTSSTADVTSCRGPSCDSEHFLVKVTLRERLSNALKNQGRTRKRWNIDKLKNEENLNLYEQKINEKLEDTSGIPDVQTEWNKIENVMVEAAKESLGEKKEKRNECRTAIQEKNNMRKIMLQRVTGSSKETY